MILDWKKYCEKVYKTNKLSRTDPSDNKSVFSHEAHYLKYLTDVKGLELLEVNVKWRQLKNGTAVTFSDDPEQQLVVFMKIYKASNQIARSIFEREYRPIRIYASEKNILNSVNAPVWMKKYWCAMLVYWKFASQFTRKVGINTTLCNWAMRQTGLKDYFYGHHQSEIAKHNIKGRSGFIMSIDITPSTGLRFYWFNWVHIQDNEKFVEIKTLDNLKKNINTIISDKVVCSQCGAVFMPSSRRKTDLCPSCYKKYRINYKKEDNRKRYYSNKNNKTV